MSNRLYCMNDCVIELPGGFVDRTTHVLEWSAEDGTPIVLGTQRDRVPEPMPSELGPPPFDFGAFVAEQVRTYPAQFPGFKLERDEVSHVSGVEFRRKGFRWRKDQQVLYNLQVFALAAPTILVFSATATAKNRAVVDAMMENVIAKIQVRTE